MSLDKAIEHGKEYRAMIYSRKHGRKHPHKYPCGKCESDRTHNAKRRQLAASVEDLE